MTETIKQAKTNSKFMGQPVRRLPQTSTNFPIPFTNGEWKHGLKEDNDPEKCEVRKVEKFFNHSFSNPEHNDYWGGFRFKLSHETDTIDSTNMRHLLKKRILQDRGQLVSSLRNDGTSVEDFVLYNEQEETNVTASLYKRRDKAIVELNKLSKTPLYIIAVANYLLPENMWVNNEETAYVRLRDFIEGREPFITQKGKNIESFFFAVELEKEELYVSVDVKEALKRNVIRKVGNSYQNMASGITYGRNTEEVITFLMSPANQDELGNNSKNDLPTSIRQQLKNKR